MCLDSGNTHNKSTGSIRDHKKTMMLHVQWSTL